MFILPFSWVESVVDSELQEDRLRQVLEAGSGFLEGAIRQKDSGNGLVIHLVVTAPLVDVVGEDFLSHCTERRMTRDSRSLGGAHDDVGADLEVTAVLVGVLALIGLGHDRTAGLGVDLREERRGDLVHERLALLLGHDPALLPALQIDI
jgi:hypothetical protein